MPPSELVASVAHIHSALGFFTSRSSETPMGEKGATVTGSFEAEQHLLHLGRSSVPVCWTICGLLGGYLSQVSGTRQFVLEDRCVAQGNTACRFSARTREAWGHERESELTLFEPESIRHTLAIAFGAVSASVDEASDRSRRSRKASRPVVSESTSKTPVGSRSRAMQKTLDLAVRVAAVDATVLITGESGAGKERIARLIHEESPRGSGPFIAVNCGAITESLLESELFGHKRGSFTGASSDRVGLFEAASKGTLLLDEVGEVSMGMQVKLLRALQERAIRRVGESKSVPIDVRILAATNRDLMTCVEKGTFRQDLYYRLNVVEVSVPSLRDRGGDIIPLARTFLEDAAERMHRNVLHLSPEAADRLSRHDWPGNVRELENAIERAVALASGTRVELRDLPGEVRESRAAMRASGALDAIGQEEVPLRELEKRHILATLERNHGNQTKTAEQLEIGTATLYRKLRKYEQEEAERSA